MYVVEMRFDDHGLPGHSDPEDPNANHWVVGVYLSRQEARDAARDAVSEAMINFMDHNGIRWFDESASVMDVVIGQERIRANVYFADPSNGNAVLDGDYVATRSGPRWAEATRLGWSARTLQLISRDLIPADLKDAVKSLLSGDAAMLDALRDVLAARK